MEVSHSLIPGMKPLASQPRLPGATSLAPGGVAGTATRPLTMRAIHVDGGGGVHAPHAHNAPRGIFAEQIDGPTLVTATGVRIRRMRIGQARVSEAALQQALAGLAALPTAHQTLIARLGVTIDLVPSTRLAPIAGLDARPVLGATNIARDETGTWIPTGIRVAVNAPSSIPGTVEAVGEVLQHEVGHVIAVTSRQDRSEAAAIAYARRY